MAALRSKALLWSIFGLLTLTNDCINGQITVTVVSNPVGTSVTGSPNTFDYPILSTVNLTCMVDPSPSLNASYRWNTTNCYTNNYYNNGIPGCFPHGKTAQTVTGKNLTAEDAGTVTCTVTINGTDFISTSFTLRISGIAITNVMSMGSQRILTDYSYITTRSAYCASGLGPTGDTNAELGGWYFNGNRLLYQGCYNGVQPLVAPISNTVGVVSLVQCGTFYAAAEGVYTCTIMNGSMVYQSMRLGIYFVGRIAPVIDTPSSSVITVIVGTPLILYCVSQGSPPDTFTWRKDNGSMLQSTDITAVNHTNTSAAFRAKYSVDNVTTSDNGTYTCIVTNPIGSDSTSITVIVGSIPPFQPIVMDVAIEPNSVTISWTVANIAFDHENYTVIYGTERAVLQNTSEVVEGDHNVFATDGVFNVTIAGLTPFTTYYYILLANNSIGSTSSNLMNFTTNETAPTAAPKYFRVINVTSTSITFQWDHLITGVNGLITKYVVTCKNQTGNSFVVNVSGISTVVRVPGLNAFTIYTCSIHAVTVSDGPMSDSTIVITAEAPPNPPAINTVAGISGSVVRVTWTKPTMPNGFIRFYTIIYLYSNGTGEIKLNYTGAVTQFYDITDLAHDDYVIVCIAATNGGGRSDIYSSCADGITNEGVPGVVDIYMTSDSYIIWMPPLQRNGIIIGYQVIYSVYQIASTEITSPMISSSYSEFYPLYDYNIQGLSEGIPYEVVVVAFTSVGRGEENNRTVFFSRELFPTKPPGDVNIKQLNSTSINVTWTPLTLFEARGFPLYRVVLTPMDANSNLSKIVVETKSSFATITNLSDSIQYSIVVGVRTTDSLVRKAGSTEVSVRFAEGNNVSVFVKTTDDDDNEIMLCDGETTCQYIPFIVSLVITILLGLPSWIVCYCKYKSTIKSGLSSCISKICRSKHFNIKHNGGDKKNKSSLNFENPIPLRVQHGPEQPLT